MIRYAQNIIIAVDILYLFPGKACHVPSNLLFNACSLQLSFVPSVFNDHDAVIHLKAVIFYVACTSDKFGQPAVATLNSVCLESAYIK